MGVRAYNRKSFCIFFCVLVIRAFIYLFIVIVDNRRHVARWSIPHLYTLVLSKYITIRTVNIQVHDGGVEVHDSSQAHIVPGLAVILAAVRGLDIWHAETLSTCEQASVFKQPVAAGCDRRVGVAAAAKGHKVAFDNGSWRGDRQLHRIWGVWGKVKAVVSRTENELLRETGFRNVWKKTACSCIGYLHTL